MSSDLKNPLTGGTEQRLSRVDLENVPVPAPQRKCTDVLFCVLFLVGWVGMIVLAISAVSSTGGINGYQRLTNGVQYDGVWLTCVRWLVVGAFALTFLLCVPVTGSICGYSKSVKSEKFLWWPDPVTSEEFAVCVPACPNNGDGSICATVNGVQKCWDTYATKAVYHYCLPSSNSKFHDAIENDISAQTFGRMIADLRVVRDACSMPLCRPVLFCVTVCSCCLSTGVACACGVCFIRSHDWVRVHVTLVVPWTVLGVRHDCRADCGHGRWWLLPRGEGERHPHG